MTLHPIGDPLAEKRLTRGDRTLVDGDGADGEIVAPRIGQRHAGRAAGAVAVDEADVEGDAAAALRGRGPGERPRGDADLLAGRDERDAAVVEIVGGVARESTDRAAFVVDGGDGKAVVVRLRRREAFVLSDELGGDDVGLAGRVSTIGEQRGWHRLKVETDRVRRVGVAGAAVPCLVARRAHVEDAASAAGAGGLVELRAGVEGERRRRCGEREGQRYKSEPGSTHVGSSVAPPTQAASVRKSGSSRVVKTLPPPKMSAPRW
jgi:hypothetical protein